MPIITDSQIRFSGPLREKVIAFLEFTHLDEFFKDNSTFVEKDGEESVVFHFQDQKQAKLFSTIANGLPTYCSLITNNNNANNNSKIIRLEKIELTIEAKEQEKFKNAAQQLYSLTHEMPFFNIGSQTGPQLRFFTTSGKVKNILKHIPVGQEAIKSPYQLYLVTPKEFSKLTEECVKKYKQALSILDFLGLTEWLTNPREGETIKYYQGHLLFLFENPEKRQALRTMLQKTKLFTIDKSPLVNHSKPADEIYLSWPDDIDEKLTALKSYQAAAATLNSLNWIHTALPRWYYNVGTYPGYDEKQDQLRCYFPPNADITGICGQLTSWEIKFSVNQIGQIYILCLLQDQFPALEEIKKQQDEKAHALEKEIIEFSKRIEEQENISNRESTRHNNEDEPPNKKPCIEFK